MAALCRALALLAALAAAVPSAANAEVVTPAKAEGAAVCDGVGSADNCNVEGDLVVDPMEEEASLNMLQKRGVKLQENRESSHSGMHSPNNSMSINWDSSKHGNGPIWRHWKMLTGRCNVSSNTITRTCRRAMAAMATSVFMLLKRKEGHNYTFNEIRHFRRRFGALLKQNLTVGLEIKHVMEEYGKWKEALFHIYELMRPAVTKQLVDEINSQNLGWVAHYRDSMAEDSLSSVMGRTGLELSDAEAAALLEETRSAEAEDLLEISKSPEAHQEWFDSRERWPECGTILRHVRYQDCNNCWSHASALVTESRVCIASHGRLNGRDAWLSQSFIALCRPDGRDYCHGGSGSLGFATVNRFGVPTGSANDRGNAERGVRTCVPQIKPHLTGQRCPAICSEYDYPRSLEYDLFYPRFSPRSLSPRGYQTFHLAKMSMLQEGPVLFGMTVFTDFWSYYLGIYRPSRSPANRNMGGHAVTGMGFGPGYFLCTNSWGTYWGMSGTFQVAPEAIDLVVVLPGVVTDSRYPTPVP